MAGVGESAFGEPWFDGVIEVPAGHLVALRIEDHRHQPALGSDLQVDPGLQKDGALQG